MMQRSKSRYKPAFCVWITTRLAGICFLVFGVGASVSQAQVYVQDSPVAAELLAEADDRLRDQQPEEAARIAQKVLDEHGSKLLEREPGLYAEAKRVVVDRLSAHAELLEAYRRLFEPQAQRLARDAADHPASLLAVFERFPMTDSGLDSALRAAGLELGLGISDTAVALLRKLEGHPSLTGPRLWTWHQQSAAAAILSGSGDFEPHFRALREQGLDETAEALLNMKQSLPVVNAQEISYSALVSMPPSVPLDQLKDPLWTHPLGGAELFMRRTYNVDAGQLEDEFSRGKYLNIMPVLRSDRLYVNDGYTVSAIESGGGRLIWETTLAETLPQGNDQGRFYNHWLPNGMDLNTLAVAEGYVVAVGGFGAASTPYPTFVPVPSSTSLACLDSQNGRLLWQKTPSQADADLTDAFWYGQPLVHGGQAYVTVRRRQRTQFQDAFVLALELTTGRTLWKRHLGSIAIGSRQVVPPLTHSTLDSGRLYIDTKLGTVACVSVVDGTIEWLNASQLEPRQRSDAPPRPWEVSGPVLTDSGLLVLDPDNESVAVFDIHNGRILQKVPAQRWGWPTYMVKAGRDVIAVGNQVLRVSGTDLSVLWTFDTNVEELRGRVAITQDYLYIPLAGTLRLVGAADGKLTRTIAADLPVNLLVWDGQVIAANRRGLESYSTWDSASSSLRKRHEKSPETPQPLLSLAWLALRNGRTDDFLQSLDAAVRLAAESGDDSPHRQAVVEQVLAMARSASIAAPDTRQRLFDHAAVLSRRPEQEAAYRLAYGEFLESVGRQDRAIEQYQWVLADPDPRGVVVNMTRPAGIIATERLAGLIESHGRAIYAKYDDYALHQLQLLRHERDSSALIELAEAYPLSYAAAPSLMLAAQASAESHQHDRAVALLRRAQSYPLEDEQAVEVLTHEARLLESIGQPRRATQVLRYLRARYPRATQSRLAELDAWAGRLQATPSPARVEGTVQTPLRPPVWAAAERLLHPTTQDPVAPSPANLLSLAGRELTLRDARTLSRLWTHTLVDASDVELLSCDTLRYWLWQPESSRLTVLSAASGSRVWQSDSTAELLGRIRPLAAPVVADMEALPRNRGNVAGRARLINRFAALDGELEGEEKIEKPLLFSISDLAVVFADSQGRMTALSAAEGAVLWQIASEVRMATHLISDGRHVFIAGLDQYAEPLVCIYDSVTGRPLHRIVRAGQAQRTIWMGLDHDGRLLLMSHRQLEAFDLARATTAWKCQPATPFHGPFGAILDASDLIVQLHGGTDEEQSFGGDLLRIDLQTGEPHARMPVSGSLKPPLVAGADRGQLLLMGADRSMMLDTDGLPLWRDAITSPHRLLDFALDDRHVILLAAPTDPTAFDTGLRHLFFLDRTNGLILYEQPVENPMPIHNVRTRGSRLILSGPGITAVFGE